MITRHFVTIPETGRKVHYRLCGAGPVLVMAHQSPRSSAEYSLLMEKWGKHFTCIAPDTPCFGQSDALPEDSEINDFGDAYVAIVRALGVEGCAAYGFHSGGIILMNVVKRYPELLGAVAIGGYAVWTPEERALFDGDYLPPYTEKPFGDHLIWLWNRVLEETWQFPWFDVSNGMKLTMANDDPVRVQTSLAMLLDAGPAYRTGYGAVLRAPREVPPADAVMPPVLISAFDADPLQAHIDRLPALPGNWRAEKVATPEEQNTLNLAWLREHAPPMPCPAIPEDDREGWIALDGGLIHWRGQKGSPLTLHGPAQDMDAVPEAPLAIDVPGHGLSDAFEDIAGTIAKAAEILGAPRIDWPAQPAGDPARLYPDLTPDRFGAHLLRAWAAARAEAIFAPWYEANHANRLPIDPAMLTPQAINRRFLARLRAGDAARDFHALLQS